MLVFEGIMGFAYIRYTDSTLLWPQRPHQGKLVGIENVDEEQVTLTSMPRAHI